MPRLTGFILTILLVFAASTTAWAQTAAPTVANPATVAAFDLTEFQGQVVLVNLDKKASAATKMAARIMPGIQQFMDREGQLISSHIGFLKSEAYEKEQSVQAALKQEGPR